MTVVDSGGYLAGPTGNSNYVGHVGSVRWSLVFQAAQCPHLGELISGDSPFCSKNEPKKKKITQEFISEVFNCFTDMVSSWFVDSESRSQALSGSAFSSDVLNSGSALNGTCSFWRVVSHCLLQCCATSVFSCLSDPILLLTQVSNY